MSHERFQATVLARVLGAVGLRADSPYGRVPPRCGEGLERG